MTARRAGEIFEAMLLAPVLRPMLEDSQMLGDYEVDLLAQEIARRDASGFGALIASTLEEKR